MVVVENKVGLDKQLINLKPHIMLHLWRVRPTSSCNTSTYCPTRCILKSKQGIRFESSTLHIKHIMKCLLHVILSHQKFLSLGGDDHYWSRHYVVAGFLPTTIFFFTNTRNLRIISLIEKIRMSTRGTTQYMNARWCGNGALNIKKRMLGPNRGYNTTKPTKPEPKPMMPNQRELQHDLSQDRGHRERAR